MTDALTVDLPDPLARELERVAKTRGMTPGEFLVRAAAEKLGAAADAAAYFAERAKRATPGAAAEFFSRSGGEPPRPGDEVG